LVAFVKWQNGTDRQIDRYIDEKRASQTLPLRFPTVSWCKNCSHNAIVHIMPRVEGTRLLSSCNGVATLL
jgi:hypothetical protein